MLTIRKATLSDTDRIVPLWVASMLFHEKYGVSFQTAPDFREHIKEEIKEMLEKPHITFFIAERDNDLLGFSMTTISDRPKVLAKAKRGYIGYTFVDEPDRGQGIGTQLVAEVMKWFKSQDVDLIDLLVTTQNEAGVRFWQKNGFKTLNYFMVHEVKKE